MAAPTREEAIAYLAAAAANATAADAAVAAAAARASALDTLSTNVRSQSPPVFHVIADGDEGVADGVYIFQAGAGGVFSVLKSTLLKAAQ